MLRLFVCVSLACVVSTELTSSRCCWSKWGDKTACGDYPASSSGGKCTTDWTKTCNQNSDCPDTPGPAPTPSPPTPSPTPAPPSPAPPLSEVVGYWATTWQKTPAPSNANLGIAFSGWADPVKAKSASDPVHDSLVGDKWIDAGGGNANGRWSADWLKKWETTIATGDLKQWKGIVFDIEECSNGGLAPAFASVFKVAKAAGLQVLVTVSHSAPYGCSDPDILMKSFFPNTDVDFLSPQLYTNGNEPDPMFDAGNMVKWEDWTGSKGRLVPSLGCLAVKTGGYQKTKDFFTKYSLKVSGYIVWPSKGCSLSNDTFVV